MRSFGFHPAQAKTFFDISDYLEGFVAKQAPAPPHPAPPPAPFTAPHRLAPGAPPLSAGTGCRLWRR
jgi:hypothetical protein